MNFKDIQIVTSASMPTDRIALAVPMRSRYEVDGLTIRLVQPYRVVGRIIGIDSGRWDEPPTHTDDRG